MLFCVAIAIITIFPTINVSRNRIATLTVAVTLQ